MWRRGDGWIWGGGCGGGVLGLWAPGRKVSGWDLGGWEREWTIVWRVCGGMEFGWLWEG